MIRLRPIAAALPLVVLAALATGCGDSAGVPRYDDLVTDAASRSVGGEAAEPRVQELCADQTRFVQPLEADHRLVFDLDLGDDPRLVLTYCRPRRGRGELRVAVRALTDGAPGAVEIGETRIGEAREISGWPDWQRWELDLRPLAGRRVRIGLSTTLPHGSRLLLRDAYVEHRAAAAAGWPVRGVHVEAEEAAAGGDGEAPAAAAGAPPAALAAGAADDSVAGSGARILLISVDTLRADVLEATTAAGEPLAPRLRRLAAEGEVFSPHHAGASWTKPSHATLLSGFPLSVHRADGTRSAINPGLPTLAERLRQAGLATGAMVHDCVWLNPKYGFDRGFDDYRSVKWGAGQIARGALNWMAAHRDRPFFFFLHTFDVHSDFYHLPYEGAGATSAGVEALFGVPRYGCRRGQCASGMLFAIGDGHLRPLPREPEILHHLYAAGVAEVDAELGRLFDDLRRLGVWDDLLVVVTSDHGEMLLEHGATLHGHSWEPVLQVPLIVKWPAGERDRAVGVRTTVPTSSIDVAPTLLAAAGVEAADLPGVDLRRPRAGRAVFAGSDSWWAVYQDGWKAIFPASDHPTRLYHVDADPGELDDLADRHPDQVARLRRDLDALRSWSAAVRARVAAGGSEATELTDEERERLRALGYLR